MKLMNIRPSGALAFGPAILLTLCILSDCYDPMDPNGNITVTFDIYQWTTDGYMAKVTINNYHQYRHVDKPGWKIGWTWAKDEVIWTMSGAFATQRGNCTKFKNQIPHSCKKDPVILDFMPGVSPENMSEDCCRGGLLSAWAINPSKSFSSFKIQVGNLEGNSAGYAPLNVSLMAPGTGYTCSQPVDTDPTVSLDIDGRREVQVFRTWKSTCTYSSFLENKAPVCCVSLSTFYNPTITECPACSCGCKEAGPNTSSCVSGGTALSQSDAFSDADILKCSDHNCPIRVHWHLKSNYVNHWRVKITVSNYNFKRNYSDWNVLVQHPGLSKSATTYSFNSSLRPTVGFEDEVALFWGIDYYNSQLLQADKGQVGSVTTEILMEKDMESFTLANGWAFPRSVYFSGENCEMPLPDNFPGLPSGILRLSSPPHYHFILLITILTLKLLNALL